MSKESEQLASSSSTASILSRESEDGRTECKIPLAHSVPLSDRATQTDSTALLSTGSMEELQSGISAQVSDFLATLDISGQVADIVKQNLQGHT